MVIIPVDTLTIINALPERFLAIPEVGADPVEIEAATDDFSRQVRALKQRYDADEGPFDDLPYPPWVTIGVLIDHLVDATDSALWGGSLNEWDSLKGAIDALVFVASLPVVRNAMKQG